MERVEIRLATLVDVPRLAELRREWTLEDADDDERRRPDFDEAFVALVSEGIESGRWVVWLAEVEGEIASHAFVCVVDRIPRAIEQLPTIGYLTNVYTRPEHRGRGVGGRLLDAVTAWAREAGIALLFVWPSEESIPFYERHGFADRDAPLVWLPPRSGD